MASSVVQQPKSLQKLVAQRLEESDAANPSEIVDSLITEILNDEDLLYETLQAALPMYVGQVQREIRSHHWWESRTHFERETQQTTQQTHSERWAKAAEVVNEQQEFFRDRVWVNNQWRFLGDLSREECMLVHADYSNRAWLAQRNANRFKRLAQLMQEYNAQCVAELGQIAFEAFED